MQQPGPGLTQTVRFPSADGSRLAGTLLPGEEPRIALAHGFGQTRESWSATQGRLGDEGYGSLAWDMRGHGQSARNDASLPYSETQFVDDQFAAAQATGLRPVLVGASMGGLTGLLAQARKRVFSAIVLVDVTPRWEAAGMQRIHDFMTAFPDGFDSFAQAASAIAEYLPQRRTPKTPEQLSSLLRRGEDSRLRWHWDPRLLGEFVAGSHALQDALSSAASRIDVPVLLISGERSDLVSAATIADFLELVPQASHVQIEGATHMLAGDDNDAFTGALLAFLRAQFPKPAASSPAFAATASGAAARSHHVPGVSR